MSAMSAILGITYRTEQSYTTTLIRIVELCYLNMGPHLKEGPQSLLLEKIQKTIFHLTKGP